MTGAPEKTDDGLDAAIVEAGLKAAEDEHTAFMFGDDAVRDGFTFDNSFTQEFKDRFRSRQRAAIRVALIATAALLSERSKGRAE